MCLDINSLLIQLLPGPPLPPYQSNFRSLSLCLSLSLSLLISSRENCVAQLFLGMEPDWNKGVLPGVTHLKTTTKLTLPLSETVKGQ